jgi:hypothetical protein
MKNILLTFIAIILFSSCKKEEGNYDVPVQVIGLVTADVNGEPWVGDVVAMGEMSLKARKRFPQSSLLGFNAFDDTYELSQKNIGISFKFDENSDTLSRAFTFSNRLADQVGRPKNEPLGAIVHEKEMYQAFAEDTLTERIHVVRKNDTYTGTFRFKAYTRDKFVEVTNGKFYFELREKK